MTTPKEYYARAGRALLRHLAVGGSIGLVFGFALSPLILGYPRIATIAAFVVVGMDVAVLWLYFKVRHKASRRGEVDPHSPSDSAGETTPSPKTPPAPFDSRLARFLRCDESELRPERTGETSKMRFWRLVPPGRWHGPKPRWRIRYLLERIRTLVRGGKNRR